MHAVSPASARTDSVAALETAAADSNNEKSIAVVSMMRRLRNRTSREYREGDLFPSYRQTECRPDFGKPDMES